MPNENPSGALRVLLFSQLREVVGAPAIAIPFVAGETVGEFLPRLYQLHPALEKWDRQILVGVGVEFVRRDYLLQPNDEVAIMPPVQGG